MDRAAPTFRTEPATAAGPVAAGLLARYFAELAARFPAGFDGAAGGAAPAGEMAPPGGAFLVVWEGDRPVACGGLRRLRPGEAELKHMWVDPERRGRGVARRLLARLEEAAADLGYARVRLDTSVHLPEAVALYRRAGWTETAPYNDNPYAGHWFVRQLGAPLGYLFWHAPAGGVDAGAYEEACRRWQAALAASPPPEFLRGVTWRLPAPPWLAGWPPTVYADLYTVSGYAALGVLGAAAVTGDLATPHQGAARLAGHGTAGLYRRADAEPGAAVGAPVISFVDKEPGLTYDDVLARLAGAGRSVWMRQLTLGPGPELLVVTRSGEPPSGASWSAPALSL